LGEGALVVAAVDPGAVDPGEDELVCARPALALKPKVRRTIMGIRMAKPREHVAG